MFCPKMPAFERGGLRMIFITGGAGFIGSNFLVDWFSQTDEKALVIDKLTYAGNLDNLASLNADARMQFERMDICDGESDRGAATRIDRARCCTLPPKAPSIVRFSGRPIRTDECQRTFTLLEAVPRALADAW